VDQRWLQNVTRPPAARAPDRRFGISVNCAWWAVERAQNVVFWLMFQMLTGRSPIAAASELVRELARPALGVLRQSALTPDRQEELEDASPESMIAGEDGAWRAGR